MRVIEMSENSPALAPGDVRNMGAGTTFRLVQGVQKRPDWSLMLSAFPIAIGRGASVVWEG